MHTLIKIGEMARLFGLNIRTLRYYDKIGLLKPTYTNPDTGYRYYSIEQFEQLNTIRYLQAQGMSLESIQNVLLHRNPRKMQALLREQRDMVTQQIHQLELQQLRLENRIRQIDKILDPERLNRLWVCEVPERPIVSIDLALRGDTDLEMHLRSLERKTGIGPSYFMGKVGLSMWLEQVLSPKPENYQSLFCLIEPGESDVPPDQALPAGLWAKWRFPGDHTVSYKQYPVLLQKLAEQGLRPIGDAAEFALLDGSLTDNPDEYTTEIQIPVVKF